MKAHIFPFLLTLFCVAPSFGDVTNCQSSSTQAHFRLRDDLLCDYYYDIRPKLDHRNATVVRVSMVVMSVSYDMYAGSFVVNSWMPMDWQDDHLKWNASQYDNISSIHFHSNEIWTPDLSLYNNLNHQAVQRSFDSNVDCNVAYQGNVSCVVPHKHEVDCKPDLRYYPYDSQTCVVVLGSWVHTGHEIQFNLEEGVHMARSDVGGEWKVQVRSQTSGGRNKTESHIYFIFSLKRVSTYHEITILIPAVVIIAVVLITFLINIIDKERLYLIMFSFLIHMLFIQNLSWELPKNGENVPIIVQLSKDSLIMTLIQFLLTVILSRIINSGESSTSWISGAIATIVQSRAGQAILIYDNSVRAAAMAKGDEDGANIIDRSQSSNNLDYILFAKLLDRLLCVIFLIIYLTMFIRLLA